MLSGQTQGKIYPFFFLFMPSSSVWQPLVTTMLTSRHANSMNWWSYWMMVPAACHLWLCRCCWCHLRFLFYILFKWPEYDFRQYNDVNMPTIVNCTYWYFCIITANKVYCINHSSYIRKYTYTNYTIVQNNNTACERYPDLIQNMIDVLRYQIQSKYPNDWL